MIHWRTSSTDSRRVDPSYRLPVNPILNCYCFLITKEGTQGAVLYSKYLKMIIHQRSMLVLQVRWCGEGCRINRPKQQITYLFLDEFTMTMSNCLYPYQHTHTYTFLYTHTSSHTHTPICTHNTHRYIISSGQWTRELIVSVTASLWQ